MHLKSSIVLPFIKKKNSIVGTWEPWNSLQLHTIYRQIELAADRIRERGTPHFQDRTEESLHLTTSEPARSLSPSLFRFHVNSYGRQARDGAITPAGNVRNNPLISSQHRKSDGGDGSDTDFQHHSCRLPWITVASSCLFSCPAANFLEAAAR